MPIFDFQCSQCDHEFDVLVQRLEYDERESLYSDSTANQIITCEKCGCTKIKKKISNTSFALKGGCWAKDNYQKSTS